MPNSLNKIYESFLNIEDDYTINKFKTGISKLDFCLCGGFNEGNLVDFRGGTSSGKSLVALSIIKANLNKNIIYINANKKYCFNFMEKANIDASKIKVINTNCAEDIFNILFRIMPEKLANIIVFDDIASLKAKFNDNENVASIFKKYKDDFLWCLSRYKSLAIFINQNRFIKGEEVYICQRLLDKKANYILYFKQKSLLRYNNNYIGQKIKISINKPILENNEIDIRAFYNKGIDEILDYIDMGLYLKIVTTSGNWLYFNDINLGNGIYNSSIFLRDNKIIFDKIKNKVNNHLEEYSG